MRTVEVDGDVDDTRVLIVGDKYLTISSVFYTRCLNCRRTRTVAPVHTSAARKTKKYASIRDNIFDSYYIAVLLLSTANGKCT